jgi:hypothetical protein
MFREARFPTHTGIFAERDGQLTLIHAYMPYGRVSKNPSSTSGRRNSSPFATSSD